MVFFFVNVFYNNTWTFLIKFLSHNKILPWFFVHNTFILFYLGLWFSAIPSLVVPNFAPQKVPPLIQDEHGNIMEDSEWGYKGSRWCYKVDACTSSYAVKWCFVSTWIEHTPFKCKPRDHGIHLLILGGVGNKIMVLWMFVFWTTRMHGKSEMRRRPLIKWKRKWN